MKELTEFDVTKLYEMLKSVEQQQAVGRRVLKALIADLLRSKLGRVENDWADIWIDTWVRTWNRVAPYFDQPAVQQVLQQLLEKVRLSEDEQRILTEVEKTEDKTGGEK